MGEKKYKLEIVDNKICKQYELNLYSWSRKHWWNKEKWNFEYSHHLGHNYESLKWAKLLSSKELFDIELISTIKKYYIIEFHRITITNNYEIQTN